MTHHVEKTIRVKIPATKIWDVLNDFSSVEKFATTIKSSPIIGDKPTGQGARRLCTFEDGSSLVEEITEFHEGQGYKMELSEFSLPLKFMQAEMRVKKVDEDTSDLFMASDFAVKGGPLGWVMGALLMRPMMKGVFKKVLSGLAYHTMTGKTVEKSTPFDKELKPVLCS